MWSAPASALVSGGKDSIYSAYLFEAEGGHLGSLVTMRPSDPDSMLFHTPNLAMVELQARAWSKNHEEGEAGSDPASEAEALRVALGSAHGPVIAGAIESSYQWTRLQRLTFELGRPLFAPLWGKSAGRVVREEIAAGLDIRLVHLAAENLKPEWLGRRLDVGALEEIERLQPRVHPAGEGGEFETLVVDAPFFQSRIELDEVEKILEPSRSRLIVKSAHLVPKRA